MSGFIVAGFGQVVLGSALLPKHFLDSLADVIGTAFLTQFRAKLTGAAVKVRGRKCVACAALLCISRFTEVSVCVHDGNMPFMREYLVLPVNLCWGMISLCV